MGKATKWLRLLLSGKKEKKEDRYLLESRSGPMTMGPPPMQEKKRWSFRRSVTGTAPVMEQKALRARGFLELKHLQQKRQNVECLAMATAAVEDAAAIRLTDRAAEAVEEDAAVKIQSVFRSYLARKALCALKGIVKFQALIRGHLVRRQATAALRSMQAMVIAQARARTQRLRMLEEAQAMPIHRQNIYRRSPQEARSRNSYEMEENIKIVEMDLGEPQGSSKSRNYNHSYIQPERRDRNLTTYSETSTAYRRDPYNQDSSPARSTSTLRSPSACSGHIAESISLSENIPCQISKSPVAVSRYMANTESSKAKTRSHSAPKQRSDSSERPPMKRRPSVDGSRSAARGGRDPWSIKFNQSSVSLQESECGSTSSVLMKC